MGFYQDFKSIFVDACMGGAVGASSAEAVASQLPGRTNGPADAYRHLLWGAELTRKYGESKAHAILNMHDSSSHKPDVQMDVYNNQIALKIGQYARTHHLSWKDTTLIVNEVMSKSLADVSYTDINPDKWNRLQDGILVSQSHPSLTLDNGLELPSISLLDVGVWKINPEDPVTKERITKAESNWPSVNWENNFIYETGNAALTYVGDDVSFMSEACTTHVFFHNLAYVIISDALSWGDPHLVTFCGTSYDFQIPGEYKLVGSHSDDFEVQTRQELMPGTRTISYNTAMSTKLGNTRVGLYVQPNQVSWLQGTVENDYLHAQSHTRTVVGYADDGTVTVSTGGDLALVKSPGSYQNTFGYYIKDDSGYPLSGKIIWPNTRSVPANTVISYDEQIPSDRIGFFLISNGNNHNSGLQENLPVTFQQVGSSWGAFNNGQLLSSEYRHSNPPAFAFYSDVALNADGDVHQIFNNQGQQSWEDLYGGGDGNFNDVVVTTSINQTFSLIGGDVLYGHKGANNFIYDTAERGVDTLKNFDVSEDRLTFYGAIQPEPSQFIDVVGGVFVPVFDSFGNQTGGVYVEGVNSTALTPTLYFNNQTFVLWEPLRINDTTVPIDDGEVLSINGGLISREGNRYVIVKNTGDGVVGNFYDSHIDIQPFLSPSRESASLTGLLGGCGNASGLVLNTGSHLPSPVKSSVLYGQYADSWRISQAESLFSYQHGEAHASFNASGFIKQYITHRDFSPEELSVAVTLAIAAGYNETNGLFKDVLFELLVGGINILTQMSATENNYAQLTPLAIEDDLGQPPNNGNNFNVFDYLSLEGVIGTGVAVFALVAMVLCCCCIRQKNKAKESKNAVITHKRIDIASPASAIYPPEVTRLDY